MAHYLTITNKTSWQQQLKSLLLRKQQHLRKKQHLKLLKKALALLSKLLPYTKKARKMPKSLQQVLTKPQSAFRFQSTSATQKLGTKHTPQRNNQGGLVLMVLVIYLAAFVAANLFVKHFGSHGLWFSAMFLIPFDFICRCLFHEKWKGKSLVFRLLGLTILSSFITVAFNSDALNIAQASCAGFLAAQIGAGIFYQYAINKTPFVKVNGSDLIAIVADSIVFQYIAFGSFNWQVTTGQILIKFIGGLIWYYIIFKKLKLHEKINRS